MSKVTIPKPVVLHTVMPNGYWYGHVFGYTAAQMESYAAAKVLEARPKHFADGHEAGWCSALEKAAGTILSLNPKD